MKALSVRAPWWWFILYGGKDIENREWYTNVRGRILLHAGKWWKQDEVEDDIESAHYMQTDSGHEETEPFDWGVGVRAVGGCIVGSVEITACIDGQARPLFRPAWFTGRYAFCLKDPVPLEVPIPFKGALGFFEVPDNILQGR